jgi:hypothetical protein
MEDRAAVLCGRYESPFASPGEARIFENERGGFDLADGGRERSGRGVCGGEVMRALALAVEVFFTRRLEGEGGAHRCVK